MRARKPSRFAGLVVLLAVIFGGVTVGDVAAGKATALAVTEFNTTSWEWT
jgi:hypothetical protein